MKKRLTLKSDTLRVLRSPDLHAVIGGYEPLTHGSKCDSCDDTCGAGCDFQAQGTNAFSCTWPWPPPLKK